MAQINGVQVPFVPIERKVQAEKPNVQAPKTNSFESVFQRELERLKFSKHATQRLHSRDISLDEAQLAKLREAVEKAEMKGSRDSLVMMDNTAFIVNVPNRTVVTALPISPEEENVFTNIDSVVFAH
jgi:flagellar operon protein